MLLLFKSLAKFHWDKWPFNISCTNCHVSVSEKLMLAQIMWATQYTSYLVKVELRWPQDPRQYPTFP